MIAVVYRIIPIRSYRNNTVAKFVAYLRVSTNSQAASGLGLEAQKAAVERYIWQVDGQLLASFIETESGSSKVRSQLRAAIRACRAAGATLVVAKLDRLARNVLFISELMESNVEFVAADMPQANRLTIHLLAAVAEYEREIISTRTKAALRSAKARGVKLGNPNVRLQQASGVEASVKRANEFALQMLPSVARYDAKWESSATSLAAMFNIEGIPSSRKGRWSAATIISLRNRLRSLGHVPPTII